MFGLMRLLTAKLTASQLMEKTRSVVGRLISLLRSLLPGQEAGRQRSTRRSRNAAALARATLSRVSDEVDGLWNTSARTVLRLGSVERRLRTLEQSLLTLEARLEGESLNSSPSEFSGSSEVSGPFGDPYPRRWVNPPVQRWTDE